MAMDSGGETLDAMALGKRLQAARQTAGFTQQGLCQKAGLSYSTLAKIERGAIRSPSVFTVQTIAEALGLSLDELIGKPSASSATPGKLRRRSKSGISFVYFDINGCLLRFFHRAFSKLAVVSGQPADVVETAFWHYNDQVCRGEIGLDEFNKVLAERLHMPSLDWMSYYLEAVEPMPESRELLKWAGEYYGVGLLTNIMPGCIQEMLRRGLLPDVNYDSIVDSSVVHAIKPESRIYEIAAQQAGANPDELLLVDDSRANLMAAEKLGWHVLWFDDYRPDESAKRIRQTLEPAA